MLFNSYLFLLLFFPLCLLGYYGFAGKGRGREAKIWLLGFSLWFYGYFNLQYLIIMLVSILFNFAVHRMLLGETEEKRRKLWMAGGAAVNLGVLFYFKYFDFFAENINALFGTSIVLQKVVLPLGISFFTFQQVGFLVDSYRRETGECDLVEYGLFVSFFPQLIAGPIVSFGEMMPQFQQIGKKKADWERFAKGAYLFTLGLSKKVLVADTFGRAVEYGYGTVASLSSTDALLLILFYTLQLYFDFSGYCDMARGLGWMMGIEIPVNFHSPYKAVNIIDFWKRWHITLNRFFLKYVYIPLGGNRKGRGRMYANLFTVFFLSGLWHGAGWNFLLWGVMHGVLYVLTRLYQEARKRNGTYREAAGWRRAAGIAGTFLYVNLAWVFFHGSVEQGVQLLKRVWSGGFSLPSLGMYDIFNLEEFWYVMKILRLDLLPGSGMYLMIAVTVGTLLVLFGCRNAGELAERFRPNGRNLLVTAALFVWCTLSLSGVSTFLYFNF